MTSPTAASPRASSGQGEAPQRPAGPGTARRHVLARPTVFETVEFSARTIIERLQMMAFLNRASRSASRRAARPRPRAGVFKYAGGIVDFVKHVNKTKESLFSKVGYYADEDATSEVEVAFQWNTGFNTDGIHSFANGINTVEGGTHEEGFKAALTTAVNKYARAKNQLKEKDPNLAGEDIREGITAIISVRLRDPQFEGQTKAKLGNTAMKTLVQRATNEKLGDWLEEPHRGQQDRPQGHRRRPGPGRGQEGPRRRAQQDAARRRRHARQAQGLLVQEPRRARAVHRRGRLGRRLGRAGPRPATQAILPIRGKILNVERARIDKMLKNHEIQTLISAIGAGLGDEFDLDKRRYDKVCILTDADVDGAHIRTLLLTFFFRQMKPLVEQGHVYICEPPLYSTEVGKEKVYLKDDAAKARFLAERPNRKDFQRLKGLGEMDHEELRSPRWTPPAARCCRSTSSRRRWPTRCCPSSWARTSRCASTSSRPTPTTSASSTSETMPDENMTPPRRRERRRARPPGGRAHRDPGGDGALLPGLRHDGHHRPGAARRA